jgi:hypothetical protein
MPAHIYTYLSLRSFKSMCSWLVGWMVERWILNRWLRFELLDVIQMVGWFSEMIR